MGMLMAHEMTHGYDTTGSRFDQNRALHEWWTKASRERFERRAHCIRRLYDQFEVGGKNVKGHKTLSENIADFGGLAVAHTAYLSWYNQTVGGEPSLASRRLFFIAYGQNWCSMDRPDELLGQTLQDGVKLADFVRARARLLCLAYAPVRCDARTEEARRIKRQARPPRPGAYPDSLVSGFYLRTSSSCSSLTRDFPCKRRCVAKPRLCQDV